jgi:hypothetical protein
MEQAAVQGFHRVLRGHQSLEQVAVGAVLVKIPEIWAVLAALAAAVMVEILGRAEVMALLILAAAAVDKDKAVVVAATAALELSLFATSAHSVAQAAPSHHPAVSPYTPSHRPALTRHKEKTWHILQK